MTGAGAWIEKRVPSIARGEAPCGRGASRLADIFEECLSAMGKPVSVLTKTGTGGPISPDSVLHMLHRMLKRAGLPKVRFHNSCIKIGLNQKQPNSKGRTGLVLFLFYKH